MSERRFLLRLQSRYVEPKNTPEGLAVELFADGGWQPFELGWDSPGFLVLVYALFNCQHTYMRLNCAERGFQLESAEGEIEVATDADWDIQRIRVEFAAKAPGAEVGVDDIGYITGRMEQCPASRNIKAVPEIKTILKFV